VSAGLQEHREPHISCDQALQIAHADGLTAYGDLSRYRITIILEDDGWHVDYNLTKPDVAGGGPHYVIDAENGSILKKRYEQ